ncbi:hypothetical protein DLAC_07077 [Tieghemostelium lacteum]|uniref:Lysosomal dipeptide transporter MFSD1 n=1 Tax=Tieghemostelium lacteum TaxID=361077 RepID=A0A151ZE93_TIELA|nr:hypothetical protein DLAC_07077 [Tieghemostelium lacteum]|eukprot:KYQ92230.1 hypothetical protein DLAC_07077 [Tieghemostelium lacteum]
MFKITKPLLKKALIVFLIANLGFGLQVAYSSPVALSRTFYDVMNISEEQYGLLFTFYSLPNVFMVIIGGILIDIIGTSKVSMFFCGLAAFACIITAVSMPHYSIMLLSRFLLGSGGEILLACATTMVPIWFDAKEVPFLIGVLACWFYWGNLTALVVLPAINKSMGFRAALWFVALVFVVEFLLNLLLIKFNSDRLKLLAQIKSNQEINLKLISTPETTVTAEESEMEIDGATNLLSEKKEITQEDDEASSISDKSVVEETTSGSGGVSFYEFIDNLKKIKEMTKSLNSRFWVLCVICFTGYYTMFGLAICGTDILETKFGYNEQEAGLIMASEGIVNGIVPMFAGLLLSKFRGRKIQVMMLSAILLSVGTFLLNVTNVVPLLWILTCGLGFALLNTTLMACVPLLADISIVGTAYGIMVTSYNLSIVIFPPILDSFKQHTGTYTISIWILTLCGLTCFALLCYLKYLDSKVPVHESLDSTVELPEQSPIDNHFEVNKISEEVVTEYKDLNDTETPSAILV